MLHGTKATPTPAKKCHAEKKDSPPGSQEKPICLDCDDDRKMPARLTMAKNGPKKGKENINLHDNKNSKVEKRSLFNNSDCDLGTDDGTSKAFETLGSETISEQYERQLKAKKAAKARKKSKHSYPKGAKANKKKLVPRYPKTVHNFPQVTSDPKEMSDVARSITMETNRGWSFLSGTHKRIWNDETGLQRRRELMDMKLYLQHELLPTLVQELTKTELTNGRNETEQTVDKHVSDVFVNIGAGLIMGGLFLVGMGARCRDDNQDRCATLNLRSHFHGFDEDSVGCVICGQMLCIKSDTCMAIPPNIGRYAKKHRKMSKKAKKKIGNAYGQQRAEFYYYDEENDTEEGSPKLCDL